MNEAPERIVTSQCGKTLVHDGMKRFETDVEYIRADHVDALIAAACEGLVNQAAGMADGRDEACYIEGRMRDAIPANPRAALDALLKAEREKHADIAKAVAKLVKLKEQSDG